MKMVGRNPLFSRVGGLFCVLKVHFKVRNNPILLDSLVIFLCSFTYKKTDEISPAGFLSFHYYIMLLRLQHRILQLLISSA